MAEKPSREEDDYFARQEYEKLRDLATKKKEGMAEEDEEVLKKLHWMHCPKCGHELITIGLHGVEVDRCAHCNGLWLDAGELEQVMERDGGSPLKKLLEVFKG